jgi:hypothetical protein
MQFSVDWELHQSHDSTWHWPCLSVVLVVAFRGVSLGLPRLYDCTWSVAMKPCQLVATKPWASGPSQYTAYVYMGIPGIVFMDSILAMT